MDLAESLKRLRERFDESQATDRRVQLPTGVKYTSTKAAMFLATFAFPPFSPTVLMWMDVGTRVSTCGVCVKPIKGKTPRVALHAISLRGERVFANGTRKNHERVYYHVDCFDDSLALNAQLRDRSGQSTGRSRACHDCGRLPPFEDDPKIAVAWSEKVFVGVRYDPAPLCPECGDAKWRYQCSNCHVHFKRHQVKERWIDPDLDFGQSKYVGKMPKVDWRDGKFWLCDYCVVRFSEFVPDLETVQHHQDELEREHAEIRQFEEYKLALARGERPESPWPVEKSSFDIDDLCPF